MSANSSFLSHTFSVSALSHLDRLLLRTFVRPLRSDGTRGIQCHHRTKQAKCIASQVSNASRDVLRQVIDKYILLFNRHVSGLPISVLSQSSSSKQEQDAEMPEGCQLAWWNKTFAGLYLSRVLFVAASRRKVVCDRLTLLVWIERAWLDQRVQNGDR